MAERRAGQFLVDVMLGAPGATYNSFYRGKTLDPMPPALLLPEVTDLSKWWKGTHRYVDPENQYVFVYQSTLYGPPFTSTRNWLIWNRSGRCGICSIQNGGGRRSHCGRAPTMFRRPCSSCTIIRKSDRNFLNGFTAVRWISLISVISAREPIGWHRVHTRSAFSAGSGTQWSRDFRWPR